MKKRYDIIVVGGGHNGLVAATKLASRGRKVLLLEQHDQLGGLAAANEFHKGYHTGGILNDTSRFSRKVADALGLNRHTLVFEEAPSVFIPTKQGEGIHLHANVDETVAEIAKHSQADGDRYREFAAFIQRIRPLMNDLLLNLPNSVELESGDMLNLLKKGFAMRRLGAEDMMEVMRINLMCTADYLNEWFTDEHLKAALTMPAHLGTHTGPWSPGTNLNLILGLCGSRRKVKGGAPAIIKALETAAKANGVYIQTGARVQKILVDDGHAFGVMLANGKKHNACEIIAACHASHTILDLLEVTDVSPALERGIKLFRTKGNSAIVNLALSKKLSFACRPKLRPEFARICGETLDDQERSYDASKYRQMSEQPILDIHLPAVSDPTCAPEGGDVVTMQVGFAPYDLEGGWTDAAKAQLMERAIKTLASYAPDVEASIVGSQILSPEDLEATYNLSGGHLWHGEPGIDQVVVRPSLECGDHTTPIDGLYLTGGSTRPGGGLTGLPGLLCAKAVLKQK